MKKWIIQKKNKENYLTIKNSKLYVSNLNENLEYFTFSIAKKLNNAFPEVNISNSIISVFSIFDKKMRMRTGSKLKYSLSDSKCYEILINRRKDLGKRNYDKVTIDLLNDIISYNSNKGYYFFFNIIFSYNFFFFKSQNNKLDIRRIMELYRRRNINKQNNKFKLFSSRSK